MCTPSTRALPRCTLPRFCFVPPYPAIARPAGTGLDQNVFRTLGMTICVRPRIRFWAQFIFKKEEGRRIALSAHPAVGRAKGNGWWRHVARVCARAHMC